jgi:hypothetical protein
MNPDSAVCKCVEREAQAYTAKTIGLGPLLATRHRCIGNLWRQSAAAGQALNKTLKLFVSMSSPLRLTPRAEIGLNLNCGIQDGRLSLPTRLPMVPRASLLQRPWSPLT